MEGKSDDDDGDEDEASANDTADDGSWGDRAMKTHHLKMPLYLYEADVK